jgi:virginiamycin B lyase
MRFSRLSALSFVLLSACGKLSNPPTLSDPTSDASAEDGGEPQSIDGSVAPAIDAGPGVIAPPDAGEDARGTDDGATEAAPVDASDAAALADAADANAADSTPDAASPMEDGGSFTSFGININQPYGITVGPDGNIWFTESGGGPGIGRITPSGILTEFSTPTPSSEPGVITSGPDGALWFTQSGAKQIGRCTTGADGGAPTVTEFAVPTANAGALGIVTGPDGALWFTEALAGKIGRLILDADGGTVTEFPIVGGSPVEIVSGPDGALWFTDQGQRAIGRITTSGAISEFASDTLSTPWGITSGPDGALWFTELDGNKIGRITTGSEGGSPTVTEFALPVPSGGSSREMEGIVSGPDGALWFAEVGAGAIGRITTAGAYSELAIPGTEPSPIDLTFAPDGALWFTAARGSGWIGRFAR